MRIAQISTPHERTPPERYGGTERIVFLLTEKLRAWGHEVTLFATGDSQTTADLHAFFPHAIRPYDLRGELIHAVEMLKRADEFDIIHNHLEGVLPFSQFIKRPLVTTIHGLSHTYPYFLPYFNYFRDGNYVALSQYHRNSFPQLRHVWVVNNSLQPEEFPFLDQKEDFLLFIGYFSPHKGADIAIDIARRSGQKLMIIAKPPHPGLQEYYESKIAPFIDGEQICYLGEMGEERKDFISRAKCLLFPTRGDEPFGLVLIEAMACGTPVVAYNDAAVPEIVLDGITGFVVNDFEGMIKAIDDVGRIDPQSCRQHVIRNFNIDLMVERYLEVYQQIIKNHSL